MAVTIPEPPLSATTRPLTEEEREFWLLYRQALLAQAAAIATRLELPPKRCPSCRREIKLSLHDASRG